MKTVKSAVVFAALFLMAALLTPVLASGVANAHQASVWYFLWWPDGKNIKFGFDDTFPNLDDWEQRVREGAFMWTQLGGSAAPDFANSLARADYPLAGNTCWFLDGQAAIYMENLDHRGEDTLGLTRTCAVNSTNRLLSFTIAFDTIEDTVWYTGTGDARGDEVIPVPIIAEYDLWSVASHEFGHATGRMATPNDGHWWENWEICANNGPFRHTMCPSIPVGSEMMRTPQEHDEHTLVNEYN